MSSRTLLAMMACLALTACQMNGSGQDARPRPLSDYAVTPVEGVRGAIAYGVCVQQTTHEVYVASETMRSGLWGAMHNPSSGTWKSADGGKSWKRVGPGGRNVKVSAADPKVIYANDRFGTYRTSDGGANWKTILPPEHALGYKGLDIFAGDHNIVYAAGPRGLLHASRDGGETWEHYALPVGENGEVARVVALKIHPKERDTVFMVFSGEKNSPRGVWKTTDGGHSVTQVYTGGAASGYRGAIDISPTNPDYIYCASAYSHDGGKTWKPVLGTGGGWEAIVVHPKRPEVAYYSSHGQAVCATVTGGDVFYQVMGIERNYDGTEAEGIALDGDRDILWVGATGIWRGDKASSGKARLVEADGGFRNLNVSDIKSTPHGVWVSCEAQGMHYTTDGKRWHTTAMGMQGMDAMHHVAPSPTQPNIAYCGQEARLYKTTDGGKTWFNILNRPYPACTVDPVDPNIVYLSSRSGKGDMIRTTDGGASFKEMGKGRFLGIDPSDPKTILAEREDGLYISHDRAESFEKVSDEKELGDFFISPSDRNRMFSARAAKGLFESHDGGKTWAQLAGVELNGPTRFMELPDGTLWMSDTKTGLVRSTDQGKTWEKLWDAMGGMAPDPWDKHSFYMITHGGVWWIHPKDVARREIVDEPTGRDPALKTVKVTEPLLIDRSNTTYELDRDIELTGINKDRFLAMFDRGLKNITLDGKGRTIRMGQAGVLFGDDLENLTVRNFHFVIPPAEGTNARQSSAPVLYLTNCRNLKIVDCTFEAAGATNLVTNGILTNNVTIENCRMVGGSRRGPVIDGTGRHTIRNCTIESSNDVAVKLLLAEGSVLEGNQMKGTIEYRPAAGK